MALTSDSGSSASDHITNVGTLNVSGLEAGATVSYSIDGGSTFTGSFSAVAGLNNVIVRATDVAGNTNDTAFSFTLDTSTAAPVVALTSDSGSSSSDHITNVGTLSVSGLESGATVSYSIDGGSTFTGSFSAVEGLNNVIVRATDVAGNTNDTAFSFTLDTSTAAPVVALTTDSGSSASDHITNVGTLDRERPGERRDGQLQHRRRLHLHRQLQRGGRVSTTSSCGPPTWPATPAIPPSPSRSTPHRRA